MQICHWQYIPLARELYRQHNALFHRTPTTRAYWGYIAEIFCRLCLNDLILPRFYVNCMSSIPMCNAFSFSKSVC